LPDLITGWESIKRIDLFLKQENHQSIKELKLTENIDNAVEIDECNFAWQEDINFFNYEKE
jgi:hypothetical protein